MRQFLKIFFLLPLLLSCTTSQVENDFPSKEEQNAIGFNAKAVASRAAVSSVSDITEFKVYAVQSEEPDENYEQQSDVVYNHILSNEKVYWDKDLNNGQGGFTYDRPQYWVNERTFHFFGYWPTTIPAAIDNDSVSYNLEYKATTTTAQAKDDLLTFHYSTYVDENKALFDPVPVIFNRALTQISFEITQDFTSNQYDEFCVTSVTFSGIKAGGTLTTSRFDKTGQWSFSEDKLSFSNTFNDKGQFGNYTSPKTLVVFDGLNLVPQAIAKNSISFVVNYTYEQGDSNGLSGNIENKTATIYLPISKWEPGMKYNYKVALYKNNLIVFKNIDISTWGEQPDAGTIIIK